MKGPLAASGNMTGGHASITMERWRAQSNIVVRASSSLSVCHVLSGEITLRSCPIEVHVPEGHMTCSVSEHVSLPRVCRVGTGAERLMACGREVRGPRPVKRGGSPTRFLT